MIRLIVYDLDGTLIDSRRDIANAVNWTLAQLGLAELSVDEISVFVGRGVTNLMRGAITMAMGRKTAPPGASGTEAAEGLDKGRLGGAVREPPLLKRSVQLFRGRYAEHLLDETRLYPSVREVLEHFKNRLQAVITNKPEGFSRQILEGLGVSSYFFKIIGGDQAYRKKPSPEPVLELVKAARVQPSEVVLIGDSAIDIETGKNAGVQTVAVTYGFGTRGEIEASKPDFIVRDLRELIVLLGAQISSS